MKRRLMAVLIGIFLVLAGCKGAEVPAGWSAGTVKVDGDFIDWTDLPTSRFEKQQAVFGVANDRDFLYVSARIRDEALARMGRVGEFTLWLNREGNKHREWGLRFGGAPRVRRPQGGRPSGPPAGGTRGRGDEGWPLPSSSDVPSTLWVITAPKDDEDPGTLVPIDGSAGPELALSRDLGVTTFEVRVPINDQMFIAHGFAMSPGGIVGIGIELTSGLTGRGGPMGGGPNSSGGGRGGRGGVRGGGTVGGLSAASSLPKDHRFWVRTRLAEPPRTERPRRY